jgi:spore maturation protein CgeB
MKSKKVLLVGEFATPQYDDAIAAAIKEFGIQTNCIKESQYLGGSSLLVKFQKKYKIGPHILLLWYKIIKEVLSNDFTAIYLRLCLYYPPFLLKLIRKVQSKTTIVCYMNDDPFGKDGYKKHFKHYLRNVPLFDINYIFRDLNIPELAEIGSRNTKLHLPYYCKQYHYPEIMENRNIDKYYCDAIFLGHGENDCRLDCFDLLLENDIDLVLGGGDFHQFAEGRLFSKLLPAKYYFNEEYRLSLQYSNCSICFFSSLNRDIITTRVFEIPACKGVLVCQRSELVESIFKEGEEALYFSSKEELLDHVLFLKNNKDIRNEIAENGYRKLLSTNNEVSDRVRQMIVDINEVVGE